MNQVHVQAGDRPLPSRARLILVHHTRPAAPPGTCFGRTDLDLPPGWPLEVAGCLAEVPRASCVLSSPAACCRRLARAIGGRDAAPVRIDDRLRELDFGSWEGRAWDEIPREGLASWAENLLDYAPGGGESLRMLWERVREWRAQALDGLDGDVVVVSHHGPIRALIAQLAGLTPERMRTHRVPWGSVHRVPG